MDYLEKLVLRLEQVIFRLEHLDVEATISAGDVKIGAVEIEDKDDGARCDVEKVNVNMTDANQEALLTKGQVCGATGAIITPLKENGQISIRDPVAARTAKVSKIEDGYASGDSALVVQGKVAGNIGLLDDAENRINPRKEDGHGSGAGTPSHVSITNSPTAYDVAPIDAWRMIPIVDTSGNKMDATHPLNTVEAPPTSIVSGTLTLPGTIPSNVLKRGLTLKADKGNAGDITLNSGMSLEAGESIPIEIDNSNKVIASGTASDKLYYYGS